MKKVKTRKLESKIGKFIQGKVSIHIQKIKKSLNIKARKKKFLISSKSLQGKQKI